MLRILRDKVSGLLTQSSEAAQMQSKFDTDDAVEEFVSTVATYSVLDCELQNLTKQYDQRLKEIMDKHDARVTQLDAVLQINLKKLGDKYKVKID